jgi:peptidyl-tRNA hydrolase
MIKQVIIARTDLNMRKGKLASQCCHASMKVFFDKIRIRRSDPDYYTYASGGCKSCRFHYECKNNEKYHYDKCNYFKPWTSAKFYPSDEMIEWIEGSFTKIVVGVDSLEKLLDLQKQAEKAGITNALITDSGFTEFKETCFSCEGTGNLNWLNQSSCIIQPQFLCSNCNGTGKVNKPTITCLAIGPDLSEKIDLITRDLKLL